MFKDSANIYEINTRVWLGELSLKYKKPIKFSNIPAAEIKKIKDFGFDAVWLMGIWEPSNVSRSIALRNRFLINECRVSLPDLMPPDIVSSCYAIKEYKVSSLIGTKDDILFFKNTINKLGIKLILDFVPNHLAMDSPWVETNPDFFIQGDMRDFREDPETFYVTPGNEKVIFAHGKDPYFPAWCDTIQLNYFNPLLRKAMAEALSEIASISDGVRCDMAMLVLNRIQESIWKEKLLGAGKFKKPKEEFWPRAISDIKKSNKDFVFIAESYWDTENELFGMGFDYAYDKGLYDALQYGDLDGIKMHLNKPAFLQAKMVRFIENHDEPRAMFSFGRDKSKAAISLISFMPGLHLFHEGQFEGFSVKLPIQLIRRRAEEADPDIAAFYKKLFSILKKEISDIEDYKMVFPESAWAPENDSYRNFLTVFLKKEKYIYLLAVNYSEKKSQCYVPFYPECLTGSEVSFEEIFEGSVFKRNCDELLSKGLYLDEGPFKVNLFKIT